MRQRALALLVLASGTLVSTSFAAPPRLKEHQVDLKIVGEGRLSTHDYRLDLLIVFGPLFRAGARVYAEPSHTLLFLGMSPGFAESPEAEELREVARKSDALVRVMNFGGGEKLLVPGPRDGDDRIAVVAMTGEGDFLVADAKVTLGRFHFTTSWDEWLANPTHCCYCNGEACVEARGPEFTCCWCPKNAATVGWVDCPDEPRRPTRHSP
jgi:hypothetical protein